MNYVFPILATTLWGINTLVNKMAAGVISPGQIAFLRWAIAVVILLPFAIRPILQNSALIRANWLRLSILGVLGGVIFQSLSYTAASYTTAINMGVIQALAPLATIMFASMVFRAAPSVTVIFGALVSLCGVLIVISGGHMEVLISQGINRGDTMMLVGVVSLAVYNTLLKRWQLHVPLIASMFVQALAAAIVLFPFYLLSEKYALTGATTGMIVYAVLAASILAPLSWMEGLRRLGPARASLFVNLVPLITAVLAVVFLSEPFTWSLLIGGVLALAGVVFVELMRLRTPLAL